IERLGGELILVPHEVWWQTVVDGRYAGVDGLFVHPVDDGAVMAGNGTIGLELVEELEAFDAVVVPWGGGGLATGIGSAVKALPPARAEWCASSAAATSTPSCSPSCWPARPRKPCGFVPERTCYLAREASSRTKPSTSSAVL